MIDLTWFSHILNDLIGIFQDTGSHECTKWHSYILAVIHVLGFFSSMVIEKIYLIIGGSTFNSFLIP